MNRRHNLPHTRVRPWARYQVTRSGSTTAPRVAYRFVAFQEVLPRCRMFQATTVPQSVAVGTWLRSTVLVVAHGRGGARFGCGERQGT